MKRLQNNLEKSKSLWMDLELPSFSALKNDIEADVCIIGAGIVGLTCAYTLAKEGKSVVVLDQSALGHGQTSRTTAHLSWVLDDRYFDLQEYFGIDGAKLAAQSHAKAIDYIEKIIRQERIECDFERLDGYLFVPPEDSLSTLDKELNAFHKMGIEIEKMKECPLSSSFNVGPCLRFPNQAQFHIQKYLKGLVEAITKYRGKIFCYTHVNEIKDGTPCIITTQSGDIVKAHSTIVATCTPVNDRVIIHTKQAAYRTYVVGAAIPKNTIHKGLYWDTGDPYHYIRFQKHESDPKLEWILIGGEDHRTGQCDNIAERYDRLEAWAKARFPKIQHFEYHWSGQVYEPVDSLAFIGRNPFNKHIYLATGDSGNGITHGTIAGMLIPDLIQNGKNEWEELYNPSRITLSAIKDFAEENLNTLWQYRDWLTSESVQKINNLLPDDAAVLRDGPKKIAVYKDEKGKVHLNSAFCPHLDGCVRWNDSEKTWDCPCHGSRFSCTGEVIEGPAITSLSKLS